MTHPLHPAEHRGYRELHAALTQLANHWDRLARRMEGSDPAGVLVAGAADAQDLLAELSPLLADRDLHGRPAAAGLGAALAAIRNGIGDRFLERNQAARLAALDLRHVVVLLSYLGAVADARGEEGLGGFCRRWRARLAPREEELGAALDGLGTSPDHAVAPVDGSPAGRAAHGVAVGIGALGEWFDRRAARRARRGG